MFVSYAQNLEDVLLWRALKHVEQGFYIDIGAQDPSIESVSRAFYERGWRGVHVEPVDRYAKNLRAARPDEEVIQTAIATVEGTIPFFDIPDTGLSTGKAAIAAMHERDGLPARQIEVASMRLATLLDRYCDREIHWLKIDVEDMEHEVLESWTPSNVRPWIVMVESTLPRSPKPSFSSWESLIIDLGYEFAYFDGLNRFYVHVSKRELKEKFEVGVNVFDEFVRSEVVARDVAISELRQRQALLQACVSEAERVTMELRRSTSWRITAPLRATSLALHKLLRGSRWFARGLWSWLAFRPGTRPRRVARRIIGYLALYVLAHPRFFGMAKRLIRMLPASVEDRIRAMLLANAYRFSTETSGVMVGNDGRELSARAKDIYMQMLAEQSAEKAG